MQCVQYGISICTLEEKECRDIHKESLITVTHMKQSHIKQQHISNINTALYINTAFYTNTAPTTAHSPKSKINHSNNKKQQCVRKNGSDENSRCLKTQDTEVCGHTHTHTDRERERDLLYCISITALVFHLDTAELNATAP